MNKKEQYNSNHAGYGDNLCHDASLDPPNWGEGVTLSDLNSILISFNMPTFFIIAGYLFERGMERGKKPLGQYTSDKANRMLVPYILWTMLLWLGVRIGNMVAGSFIINIGF